jgi:DNA-binding MurR/RpiR family transcriptional regulator
MLHSEEISNIRAAMERGPLTEQIVATFEELGPQLQAAARFVLEQPNEVALLSMREQAKRASVQPHTMTRFAQRLGLSGYDEVRALYASAVREGSLGFSGRAGVQVTNQKAKGDGALATEIIASVNAQLGKLMEPQAIERLIAAADLLASADRIYCLGLRSCHPVASHLAYVLSFLGERSVLLDAGAGIGLDPIRSASPKDVLFAASIAPYTRATIEVARYAHSQDVPIVAVTDSLVSPLATIARETIVVSADSPSFFHTVAPALVVGEVLAALIAGRGGEASLAAIKRSEAQLTAFGVHWRPRLQVGRSDPSPKPPDQ